MKEIVQSLCALRKYVPSDEEGVYIAPNGERVRFYYIDTLSQDSIHSITHEGHSIILYEKQKKIRIPFEILTHFELFQIRTLKRILIPNLLCPKFERLEGCELEALQKHSTQLPCLLTSDPMAQIYGYQVGDIVKIYRRNGDVYFRRVTM